MLFIILSIINLVLTFLFKVLSLLMYCSDVTEIILSINSVTIMYLTFNSITLFSQFIYSPKHEAFRHDWNAFKVRILCNWDSAFKSVVLSEIWTPMCTVLALTPRYAHLTLNTAWPCELRNYFTMSTPISVCNLTKVAVSEFYIEGEKFCIGNY